MLLTYTRNKHASATDLPGGNILARANVEETFFSAHVQAIIKVPDLEITSITGDIESCFAGACRETLPLLQQSVGLRVGPGIIKLINNYVGGSRGCPRLADLILECCEQVILRFTVDSLGKMLALEGQEYIEANRNFLRLNPRLLNSCIAFKAGSPLVDGIDS